MLNLVKMLVCGVFAVACLTANATLLLRDGGKFVYDSEQNLTWLSNFKSVGHTQTWAEANAWANDLIIDGYDGWRLPTTFASGWTGICTYLEPTGEICGNKPPPASSELATLYYSSLGNKGYADPGWGLLNVGPFINMRGVFWSATESDQNNAWVFGTGGGDQGPNPKSYLLYSVAVRTGDVGALAVPEPGSIALFLMALGILMQFRRRYRN